MNTNRIRATQQTNPSARLLTPLMLYCEWRCKWSVSQQLSVRLCNLGKFNVWRLVCVRVHIGRVTFATFALIFNLISFWLFFPLSMKRIQFNICLFVHFQQVLVNIQICDGEIGGCA